MDIDKVAAKIHKALMEDITDRRGWRQEYYQFDDEVKAEIKETHTAIIVRILKREQDKT